MTRLETLLQEFMDATWETGWYIGAQEKGALTRKERQAYGEQMQEAIQRRSQARQALTAFFLEEGLS